MKTLNEQIQRLRDILHTCYESIASKGGTLPPVGERNMTNLPDAVESVPQVISAELEELTITQNGEYLPSEGVAGFSKVVAKVVPTEKVVLPFNFRVNDGTIINGYWAGELVDVSKMGNINAMFYNCSQLQQLDVSNWDVSKITTMMQTFDGCTSLQQLDVSKWDVSSVTDLRSAFDGCTSLQKLDVSNWDVSSATNLMQTFRNCTSLQKLDVSKWDVKNVSAIGHLFKGCKSIKSLDLRDWDMSSLTSIGYAFYQCSLLESLIGGKTMEEVLANNISCLNGLKVSSGYMFYSADNIDRASLRALINGLADLTGQPAQTLNLSVQGTTLLSKLTEEDIAVAVSKNWTIA